MLFHLPLSCKPRYFAFLPVTKDEPFLILKVSPSVCILYLNFFSLLKEIILALIPLSTTSVLHSPLDYFHQHIYMLCNIYRINKKIPPFDFTSPSRYCPIHLPTLALYSKTPPMGSLNHVFVATVFPLLSETHSIPTTLHQTTLVKVTHATHIAKSSGQVRTPFPFLLAVLHSW